MEHYSWHWSKAFKLHLSWALNSKATSLMHSYLTKKKQRINIGTTYSSLRNIVFSVPKESVLGTLLFSTFLCDLFHLMRHIDFASYADDSRSYNMSDDIDQVVSTLMLFKILLHLFSNDSQWNVNKPWKVSLIGK